MACTKILRPISVGCRRDSQLVLASGSWRGIMQSWLNPHTFWHTQSQVPIFCTLNIPSVLGAGESPNWFWQVAGNQGCSVSCTPSPRSQFFAPCFLPACGHMACDKFLHPISVECRRESQLVLARAAKDCICISKTLFLTNRPVNLLCC